MALDYKDSIAKTESQIAQIDERLKSSPTALSSVAIPTFRDASNESQKKTLQASLRALQKKQLTEDWYGKDDTGPKDESSSGGPIAQITNAMSAPVYGIVGGLRQLAGEKPVPKQEFTDLLKEKGVPSAVAAPLGFALNVAFDPFNWLTAGTGALIPRVALGLTRGTIKGGVGAGLRAGAEGLKSSALQKSSWLLGHTPGVMKFGKEGYEATRAGRLSEKANKSWETYKTMTNHDPLTKVMQAGADIPFMKSRFNLGGAFKGILSYVPKGDDIWKAFNYDSKGWLDNQRLYDAAMRLSSKTLDQAEAAGRIPAEITALKAAAGEGTDVLTNPKIRANFEAIKNMPPGTEKDALRDTLENLADDTNFIDANPSRVVSMTPEITTQRLLEESVANEDLRKVMGTLVEDFELHKNDTGIKLYDDAIRWARGVKLNIGEKELKPLKDLLDVHKALIEGAFKPAHTFLSIPTMMVNYISAGAMWMMMGGQDIKKFYAGYNQAYKALGGYDARALVLDRFMSGEAKEVWEKIIKNNPNTLRNTFGIGPSWFDYQRTQRELFDLVKASGAKGSDSEILETIAKFNDEMQNEIRSGNLTGVVPKKEGFLSKMMGKSGNNVADTPGDIIASLRKRTGSGAAEFDLPAGYTVRDPIGENPILDNIEAWISAKAEAGSKPAEIYQNLMTKARAGYERMDQAGRISIATSLSQEGLTETGLRTLSRFSPITIETDIIGKYVLNGETMYKIHPMKAMEIATDALINYAAMPAAIRMLRNMPLVGGPFASFTYGMGLRTAQTLAYNPAIFNKVSFASQSFSGDKTPLERQALDDDKGFYKWYKEPNMYRSPVNFFDEYPLYVNLAGMLPYYSLNIFQDSKRTYEDVLPNTILGALDRSPMMKDPIGQALMDFIILPTILSNARPQNALGAPLYPESATAADKAFYAGRGLVDSFTPGNLTPLGFALPAEHAKFYPGSRVRQAANAKDARNQLGIPGSESGASRSVRAGLGFVGIPTHRLDTRFAENEVNKGAE